MSTKKSTYRQRVYKEANGTIQLVFGNDLVVYDDWTLLADHDVSETVEVTDHIEAPL